MIFHASYYIKLFKIDKMRIAQLEVAEMKFLLGTVFNHYQESYIRKAREDW